MELAERVRGVVLPPSFISEDPSAHRGPGAWAGVEREQGWWFVAETKYSETC